MGLVFQVLQNLLQFLPSVRNVAGIDRFSRFAMINKKPLKVSETQSGKP